MAKAKKKKEPAVDSTGVEGFVLHLEKQGRSAKTINAYSCSVRLFFSQFDDLNMENLKQYRSWLLLHYQMNTVNTRIYGMNRYLDYLSELDALPASLRLRETRDGEEPEDWPETPGDTGNAKNGSGQTSFLTQSGTAGGAVPTAERETDPPIRATRDGIYKLQPIKEQKRTYLDTVISQRDYERFKRRLKKEGEYFWYYVVRFLGATGARVSELLQIKIEDLKLGYLDLYTKGGKIRRLYFPRTLCDEAIPYFASRGIESGFIFLNRQGNLITSRGIELQLKKLAKQYRIDPATVYPHSFRHRFAKNFLKRFNDIALLADLMGHDSIETTRIYLTRSSQEQKSLIDRIVTW